jgi:hypothetical protein
MALVLTKAGISTGNTVEAYHVTQSIDAFTGTDAYDITLSGSFTLTGSFNWGGSTSPSTLYPGYIYQETDVTPSEIFNIGTSPISILPTLTGNKYYDTVTSIEYTFGTAAYTCSTFPTNKILLETTNGNLGYSSLLNITTDVSSFQAIFNKTPLASVTCFNDGLVLTSQGTDAYTTGDGTIKVKVWYKIINFG